MSQNPFEAPQAAPYVAHSAQPGTAGQIDIGEAVSTAWNAVSANAGIAVGGTIVAILVMMLGYITIIGIFLVVPVVAYGMVRLYLNILEGRGDVSDVFEGFRRYGQALGSMLLIFAIFIGISLPGSVLGFIGGAQEMVVLVVLGQIYGFVVAFLVTMRLYFAPFYAVDQGLGAIDAVKAAWHATREQKLMTVLLGLVSGIIGISGVVACGIGLLFTMPLSYVIWTAAYRQLAPAAAEPEPPSYY